MPSRAPDHRRAGITAIRQTQFLQREKKRTTRRPTQCFIPKRTFGPAEHHTSGVLCGLRSARQQLDHGHNEWPRIEAVITITHGFIECVLPVPYRQKRRVSFETARPTARQILEACVITRITEETSYPPLIEPLHKNISECRTGLAVIGAERQPSVREMKRQGGLGRQCLEMLVPGLRGRRTDGNRVNGNVACQQFAHPAQRLDRFGARVRARNADWLCRARCRRCLNHLSCEPRHWHRWRPPSHANLAPESHEERTPERRNIAAQVDLDIAEDGLCVGGAGKCRVA